MNNFVPYSRHSVHSENVAIVRSKVSSRFTFLRLPSILNYSENLFRSSISPILWLDDHGDVHWNRPAQSEFLTYLNDKQTLGFNASDEELVETCPDRNFFILQQHHYGFFSRYHCFIEQFGQTLYSSRMTLLSYRRFIIPQSHVDDFLDEGILRYFQPIAACSNHFGEPQMKRIELQVKLNSTATQHVTNIDHLFDPTWKKSEQFVVLDTEHVWHFGYQDVPIRRWLFDFESIPFTYDLPRTTLINHQQEHIYRSPALTTTFLDQWLPRNRQWKESNEHLISRTYTMTWQDHVFTSFLRYMFIVYFHRFTLRIQNLAQLLADHWSSYLMDKNRLSLRDAAAIFIRRGDKSIEDSFWKKYGRWRNISFYVKGLVDEETRRNRQFSSVFIMTDDLSVMNAIHDYANIRSKGTDEPYARTHLQNRQILYNIFAPQACFDPFNRIGFEQFLVSVEFIVQHIQFTISHSDSNVGRYLEEILYGRHQLEDSVHSNTFVQDAPDSLDD